MDELPTMDFSNALSHIKRGFTVARKGWNGKGQYISIQMPDENSLMTLPYLYIYTVQGEQVPWVPSVTDLLAEDWQFAP